VDLLRDLDRFGEEPGDDLNRLHRVVIRSDGVVDQRRVAVCIDDRDDRNIELVRFADRVELIADVDDDESGRQALHRGDAVEVAMELFSPAGEPRDLFLLHALRAVGLQHLVDVGHLRDALADRDVVGQRAAEPALGDVEHASLLGEVLHEFADLALRADEEDVSAVRHHALQKVAGCRDLVHGLGQVDDRNAVLRPVDILFHFRVPATGLVTEVTSGFQQVVDRNLRHFAAPFFCGAYPYVSGKTP
jgi:hypothetical protein